MTNIKLKGYTIKCAPPVIKQRSEPKPAAEYKPTGWTKEDAQIIAVMTSPLWVGGIIGLFLGLAGVK